MKVAGKPRKSWICTVALGLVIPCIFIFEGCASSLEREEAKVYAAYVDKRFTTVADSDEPLKRHIICDHTAGFQIVLSWRKDISRLSVAPRPDTIEDFLTRNDGNHPESSLNEETMKVIGRYPLNSHIQFKLPHVLISDATIEKIFTPGGDGWLEFNRRCEKNHGILWLSRVGFSKDRNEAILYVINQWTEAAGDGMLVLLQKQNGIWKAVDSTCCWVS